MNNSVPVSISIIVFCDVLLIFGTALGSSVDVGTIVGGITVVAVVLILAITAVLIAVIVVVRGKRTQKE